MVKTTEQVITENSHAASPDKTRKSANRWLVWGWVIVPGLVVGGLLDWGHFSPVSLFLLAAAGAIILILCQWICWPVKWRTKLLSLCVVVAAVLIAVVIVGYFYMSQRYQTAAVMEPAVVEYSNVEYPEDPAHRGGHYGDYNGRKLTLTQTDDAHFDFVLEPLHSYIAKIEIRNVDVGLMTPSLPEWAKEDAGLERIALTDRQWNRQQVRFAPDSPHVTITGGDGFEVSNIYSVELAKNCLNAGLWEILIFEKEGEGKALYYHNWFTFPLGHYAKIFEHNTGLKYSDVWYFMEHWVDPAGTKVPMDKLRDVVESQEPSATFVLDEPVIAEGGQVTKRRTILTDNIRQWKDYYDGRHVQFASFVPPGTYRNGVPRNTEYSRMDHFEKAILRTVRSRAQSEPLNELELVFTGSQFPGKQCRFIVSGFELDKLPQLPIEKYPKAYYMPMGIGTPPFYQAYDDLTQQPPQLSPFFSVLLDENDGWIDHHSVGIDGPVMHFDENDARLLHVYFLSYERHALVAHVKIKLGEVETQQVTNASTNSAGR